VCKSATSGLPRATLDSIVCENKPGTDDHKSSAITTKLLSHTDYTKTITTATAITDVECVREPVQ